MVKTQNWLSILENCLLGLELVLLIFREQSIKVFIYPAITALPLSSKKREPPNTGSNRNRLPPSGNEKIFNGFLVPIKGLQIFVSS
jgi:hypothetical protein